MKVTFPLYRYKITLTDLMGVQHIDGLAGFHLILLVSYLCGQPPSTIVCIYICLFAD